MRSDSQVARLVVKQITVNAVVLADVDFGEISSIDGLRNRLLLLGRGERGSRAVGNRSSSVRSGWEHFVDRHGVGLSSFFVEVDVPDNAYRHRSLNLRVGGTAVLGLGWYWHVCSIGMVYHRLLLLGLLLLTAAMAGTAGHTRGRKPNTAVVANLRCKPAAA